MIIDPAIARHLLSTLELREEIGGKEIAWALEIIRQIPGYKKTSIAQAAQDRSLKETLISIAREELSPTSPKDLASLLEAAQKTEVAQKAARQKGESDVKEFVEKITPTKEVKAAKTTTPPIKTPAATEVPSTTTEPVLAVALTKIAGSRESASFLRKVVFAPIKLLVEGTTPSRGGSSSAHLSYAVVQGITPSKLLPLKSKALSLGLSEKQFESFVKALSKKKFLVSMADAVNVGRELSISPSQASGLFLKPSADKSSVSVFKKPLVDRIFGGLREALFGKPSIKGGGIAKQASGAASSGAFSVSRFLMGNAGRASAPWGWAAAGGLAIGGLAISGISPTLAAGFFTGAAGSGLAAGANQVGGFGKLLENGVGTIINFIKVLLASFVETIITISVAALIAITGLTAVFLFIINSGAYVVPPQTSLIAGQVASPYIDVRKTVEGESEFENSDLPLEVTYKIEIGAKKGALSNIRVEYECEVVKEGADVDCPDVNLPDTPKIISPTEGFEFTYTHNFDSKYSDSFIIDTITVTADAPEAKNSVAAASASVKIGNPPDDCPSGWPVRREGGEPPIAIYQGPHTVGGTHGIIEAIDIRTSAGHNVTATHTGVVTVGNYGNYGNFVDVKSVCTTKTGSKKTVEITTRYAHLGTISVSTGETVKFGESVGTSDASGTEENHLHYEFRPDGALLMETPYIPQTVPRGCRNFAGLPCGVFVNN